MLIMKEGKSIEKLPLAAKVYEAYSAIASGHVELHEKEAYVTSSDETKRYTVRFEEDVYSSNDNATVWQHYAGYPILAVLMLQKRLPLDEEILPAFENVNWKVLNSKYKNKYEFAIEEFYKQHPSLDQEKVEKSVEECLQACKDLNILIKGNRAKK